MLLGAILDIKEESRTGVLGAFWNYVKVHGLQDKHDRKLIKLDARLHAVRNSVMSVCGDTEPPCRSSAKT